MYEVIKDNKDINVKGVTKRFQVAKNNILVVDDVSLEVKDGEFLSIVGSSGCGKSTILKMIAGLENVTDGKITLGDKEVKGPSIDRGMVFQESRLFPWLTVEKNIEFGIEKKLTKEEKRKVIQEHIDLVGLKGFEKAFPSQLSGGMQQRVSIARALVNRPTVLLLDEPFGALDALTKINMQNEILRIWEAEKTTMILVTHDIDEAIYLGDRIVVMSDRPGKIKKVINVNLSRARDRNCDEFAMIRKEIYIEFFGSVEIPFQYNI